MTTTAPDPTPPAKTATPEGLDVPAPNPVVPEAVSRDDRPDSTAHEILSHLTDAQIEEICRELDQIREEVISSLGERDAAYIRKVIRAQRGLEVLGRGLLFLGWLPPFWLAGTASLSVAKILENMEIGHNVMHGQWDWMRNPKIHSTTWEWDNVAPADHWKRSHNFVHHTWTNVLGKDRDVGYAVLRITPEQPWRPYYLGQVFYNMILASVFEWGVALHELELEKIHTGEKSKTEVARIRKEIMRKAGRQAAKDYLLFPALAGPNFLPVLLGNLTANLVRNIWAHAIIFCGHFPEGAEFFTEDRLEGETRGEWYVRQILGSCNISGGAAMHMMSGNLSHQIEHHLYPDMPSNRYVKVAPKVKALCERYGLPYSTASFTRQTLSVWTKIARLSFPGPAPQLRRPRRRSAANAQSKVPQTT